MKPRGVGTNLPSHGGYPLRVHWGGHTEPLEVDGRVKAIILALLRDAEEMGLERIRTGTLEFSWGKDGVNWRIIQYGERISVKEAA